MTVQSEVRTLLKGKDAGALGAIALALAKRLDSAEEPSPAAVAKELRATLAAIADIKPSVEDPVDEIKRKRADRLAKAGRGPAATGS